MTYEFPSRLLLLLRKTGTSNAFLAREVGATGTTVQNWIDDKTSPKASTACKIADFFGVDMNELCGYSELTAGKIEQVQKRHIDMYGKTNRVEVVPAELTDNEKAESEALADKVRAELSGGAEQCGVGRSSAE